MEWDAFSDSVLIHIYKSVVISSFVNIFGVKIHHIIIGCWIHGFHHLIVFIFVNRDTQQLDISYRTIAFKQTWFCIWTCTDVLGRLYLYRLGRLYLYVWQISERSPIAAMSHCSPINTRGAYTRQSAVSFWQKNPSMVGSSLTRLVF